MRYEARITAYDLFDQVAIGARVWDSHETEGVKGLDLVWVTTTFPGEGQTDPRRWLAEALVALLEQL
jgi:hypothetical protein